MIKIRNLSADVLPALLPIPPQYSHIDRFNCKYALIGIYNLTHLIRYGIIIVFLRMDIQQYRNLTIDLVESLLQRRNLLL